MKNESQELRALRLSLAERNNDLMKSMTSLKDTLEHIHACDSSSEVKKLAYDYRLSKIAASIIPSIDAFRKEFELYAQLLPEAVRTEGSQQSNH